MIDILCLAAAVAAAPSAPAGEAIGSGTRVRLTFAPHADPLAPGRTSEATRRAGRVVAVGDRTLTMEFDGHPGPVEVEKASVARIERSLGHRSRGKGARRGAGIGLLVGATSGILLGFASGGDDPCGEVRDPFGFCNLAFSAGEKAAIYGIALGALGTIGGAVVGATRSGERWERGATVFANERVGVRLVPAGRRGAGIQVAVGF